MRANLYEALWVSRQLGTYRKSVQLLLRLRELDELEQLELIRNDFQLVFNLLSNLKVETILCLTRVCFVLETN